MNSQLYTISKGVRLKNTFFEKKKKNPSKLLLFPAKRLEGIPQLVQKEEPYQMLTQTPQ